MSQARDGADGWASYSSSGLSLLQHQEKDQLPSQCRPLRSVRRVRPFRGRQRTLGI